MLAKSSNPCVKRSGYLGFRASTEERGKIEALRSLLKVSSNSAVFRTLVDEKLNALGVE